MTKKFLAVILCFALLFTCCFAVSAATIPTITISNKTAQPGEEVTVDISITNNPGIMAMAFCITYDSESLEYTGYKKGYLSKYTVKDHPDKGHIAFVNDESSDKSNDGIIISVKFKAKDTAKAKKYTITLANLDRKKYGNKLYKSFSNSNLKNIEPVVKSGSIAVAETCENSGHKYGEWVITTPADCDSTGLKNHTCVRCEFNEEVIIPITHDFEAEWTIDKAATPEEDGVMSRHCKNCDEVTDTITFSYEEIGGDDDDTSSDDTVSDTSSDDNSSNDVSSDNTTSDNVSSNESIIDGTNSSSNTSSNSWGKPEQSQKPNINNQVGEKVPQQEAEKLENYQPPKTDDDTSGDDTSSVTDTSSVETESTDTITNTTDNDTSQDDEDIYYETDYTAIIIYILLGALSLGIIVLFIVIIVRRKQDNQQ